MKNHWKAWSIFLIKEFLEACFGVNHVLHCLSNLFIKPGFRLKDCRNDTIKGIDVLFFDTSQLAAG
jgi:hypothetical protein